FCLKCGCDAPEDYKNDFLTHCPKKLLEEKLILESKTSLKLGEILIRAGKITRSHLLSAIEKQKSFKHRIGQIFIMMRLLTSEELELYLMEQKGIDWIDLKNFEVDFDLVAQVDRSLCLAHKMIPIELYEMNDKKILRVVISSEETVPALKANDRFKDFTLIPYKAVAEEVERLIKDIVNYDVFVLE
ncbi:MAG: hypothetical protein GY950_24240, partial [bacterium]|nr:hypothetical protein [bacterium]